MYSGNGYDSGKFYSSTDKGKTWTVTVGGGLPTYGAGSNGNSKFIGPHMAVDPFNEQVVLLGTASTGIVGSASNSGAYRSTNGGVNWTQIPVAQLPLCTAMAGDQTGGHTFAFDANSRVSGNTPIVYAATYGLGVYKSSDNGVTWSLLNTAGMPLWAGKMLVDLTGVLWVISQPNADFMGPPGLKYKAGADDLRRTWCASDIAIGVNLRIRRRIVVCDSSMPERCCLPTRAAGAVGFQCTEGSRGYPGYKSTTEWSVGHPFTVHGNVWMAMESACSLCRHSNPRPLLR
jgi:hypothetical protein